MRSLGNTGIEIGPLVLGGNVFGWTADAATSHALLDQFTASGLNAIDTADGYSVWVDGHKGGESETVIGDWLAKNPGKRDKVVVMSKTGMDLGNGHDLSKARIIEAVDASLRRLRTDYVDVYFSHYPDPRTPYQETLSAYQQLMDQGKIRAIGASNHTPEQLMAAEDASVRFNLPRYQVIQPEYSLSRRAEFESRFRDYAMARDMGVVTYYALAAGFLSGKYRTPEDLKGKARGGSVQRYMDERGFRILDTLKKVADANKATQAEVAIAWVIAQQGVTAPIASATDTAQMDGLIRASQLKLLDEDINLLSEASRDWQYAAGKTPET